jgi:thioesterase domain-containing protein
MRPGSGPLRQQVRAKLSALAAGGVEVHVVPGNHATLLREPHVRHLAAGLRAALASAQGARGGVKGRR